MNQDCCEVVVHSQTIPSTKRISKCLTWALTLEKSWFFNILSNYIATRTQFGNGGIQNAKLINVWFLLFLLKCILHEFTLLFWVAMHYLIPSWNSTYLYIYILYIIYIYIYVCISKGFAPAAGPPAYYSILYYIN